jgi:hypothetical protein
MRVDEVMAFEGGEMDEDALVAMFQAGINDGSVWRLQGSYGRQAMGLIESGQCALGTEPHRDYYGNLIPSRTMIQAGTKGSVEFVEARGNEVLE